VELCHALDGGGVELLAREERGLGGGAIVEDLRVQT